MYANVRDTTLYFDVDGAGLVDDDRHGTWEKTRPVRTARRTRW
ncbi:hypothetical protein [Actinomadura macra]|nr:hypothetical protein [Actinomadura macra]